jgi:hypothetical protein
VPLDEPDTLVVPDHIWGFPGVAHGGYVAGLVAERAGTDRLRMDFRKPVPVGTPIRPLRTDQGWELLGEAGVLATARVGESPLALPEPPSWAEATAGTEQRWATERAGNRGPDCYVCSVDRPVGKGMQVALGLMADRPLVAAAWVPDRGLAGPDGRLPNELIFAVADCPGGWACRGFAGAPLTATVTAYLDTEIRRPVLAAERYVVFGWSISAEGRKYLTGSAITTPEGEVCALAEALWLDVSRPAVG